MSPLPSQMTLTELPKFKDLDLMLALKMKAKSTTDDRRVGSYPYVSQKLNKVSKMSDSMVRVACEPIDLDMSTQTFQIGFNDELSSKEHETDKSQMPYNQDVTSALTLRSNEDSGSIGTMDSLSSSLFRTTFSPLIESDDVRCNPNDAVVVRDQITLEPQADNNSSSDCQTSHVLDALDSYINDLCFTEIPSDGISVFDNNVNYSIFSDYDFSGTNLICDVSERFLLFHSLEETVDATDSPNGGSCEGPQKISDNSWFHFMCHQTKPFQELDIDRIQFGYNDLDFLDPDSFMRNLAKVSDESEWLPALVSKETSKRKRITLVLDLDETLVHSAFEPCDGADFTFQVFYDNKDYTVYVRKRPFVEAFLKRVSEMFEVIIFTASQSTYAEKLLDILDTDKKFFSGRRFRDSCTFLDGCYTKDLTVLGLDLSKVFIIDNSPPVFRLQPDNGIPIKSWYDDPRDSCLMSLLPFLETLADVDDVRPIIAKKFRV
ncbi:CTD small phosphatase-like protein 2 [Senna tora]|uniref:CTD small phosphatase-like protein 2 n=1 Tax=Senna tora TaxID=362788 RepID=A0A834WML3_9FABA|nr:CTD small phosphatase-like protein 2 [Senna tora]